MDRCGDCGSVLYFDTVRTAFTYGAGEEAAQLSVDSVMAICRRCGSIWGGVQWEQAQRDAINDFLGKPRLLLPDD